MKEIGGHFIFERFANNTYHDTNLLLSSGRNCLRYIIAQRKIKTIYLPYFLCETLGDVCLKEGTTIKYYHINENFYPIIDDNLDSEFVYIVNYYGMLQTSDYKKLACIYKNIIIDNTHDFFTKEDLDYDVIYNYRKNFGVPEGACITGNLELDPSYPKSQSHGKVEELILREEQGLFEHFKTFQEADRFFSNEGINLMADFTKNYLGAINYSQVKTKREANFYQLHEALTKFNTLDLPDRALSYMYPLYINDGVALRKILLENGVYSLMLWPNVLNNGANDLERDFAKNIVLLPIDQRYGSDEMHYISNLVTSNLNKNPQLVKKWGK